MPITWQNVNGPSPMEALRGFQGANEGISGGFDKLAQVLSNREAANQVALDTQRMSGQQSFLDILQGAKTPEALAALQASGAIDAHLAGLDPKSRAAVRGAADARLEDLRKGVTSGNTFNDAQVTRDQLPLREQHAALVASGDTLGAAGFLAAHPEMRNQAPLIQTAYDTGRTREGNLRTDAAAIRGETVAVAQQPGVMADIAFKDDMRPQVQANVRQGENVKAAQLTVQEQAAKDAQDDRAIAALTAKSAASYQGQLRQSQLALGPLASALGLPLTASGTPDVSRMNATQVKQLDAAAAEHGVPGLTAISSGDTKFGNDFLTEAGTQFSPEAIARNQAKILTSFDSTRVNAPIGNEAGLIAKAQATAEVEQKDRDAANRYAPGTPTARTAYAELAKEIQPFFDKGKGSDIYEDEPHMQALLTELSTKGLDMGGGRFITPSRDDVLGAVRANLGKYNVFNSSRADQVRNTLKKQLSTSQVDQDLIDAEQSKIANRQRAVRELLNPTKK